MNKRADSTQRTQWVIHPFLFAAYPILFLYAHNLHVSLMSEALGPFQVTMFITAAVFALVWGVVRNARKAGVLVSVAVLIFFSYSHFSSVLVFLGGMKYRIGGIEVTANMLLCLLSLACVVPVIIRSVREKRVPARMNILLSLAAALFAVSLLGTLFGRFVLGVDRFVLVIMAWCGYAVIASRSDFAAVTRFMNAMSGFLVVLSLISIGRFALNTHRIVNTVLTEQELPADQPVDRQVLPDIYYLIFDEYAGKDVLQKLYYHKNSWFYAELEKRGFYIAHESRSNYPQTVLSLASSLNMTYLNHIEYDLKTKLHIETADKNLLFRMVCSNAVVKFLKQFGYTFAAFSPGFGFTEIRTADYYFSYGKELTFFKDQLFRSTPIQDFLETMFPQERFFLYDERRASLEYTFSHVGHLEAVPGPKIVFAHLICPHPPFVFGADGSPRNYEPIIFNAADLAHYNVDRTVYIKGYIDQMSYLNKRIIQMVDDILAHSKTPPVIILQGDHGPGSLLYWSDWQKSDMQERFSILNAYHLPKGAELLYPSISPVNSFRVILNAYFNTGYELLPDSSYFASLSRPYRFTDVTVWSKAR
ncbi:hypothetical protein KDK77_03155 [bacterium]|nr:hypothetical protein [bacterium]